MLDPDVAKQIAGGLTRAGAPSVKESAPQADAQSLLTNRESDVLDLLRQGLENKKIALELGLSQGTVRNHISSILQKLGVTNRTQAVIRALHLDCWKMRGVNPQASVQRDQTNVPNDVRQPVCERPRVPERQSRVRCRDTIRYDGWYRRR